MKTVEVHVSVGLVGCDRTGTFQVEGATTEDEIEELARDAMFEMIEWSWRVVEPGEKRKEKRHAR